jgi:hypothetical protein
VYYIVLGVLSLFYGPFRWLNTLRLGVNFFLGGIWLIPSSILLESAATSHNKVELYHMHQTRKWYSFVQFSPFLHFLPRQRNVGSMMVC